MKATNLGKYKDVSIIQQQAKNHILKPTPRPLPTSNLFINLDAIYGEENNTGNIAIYGCDLVILLASIFVFFSLSINSCKVIFLISRHNFIWTDANRTKIDKATIKHVK